jgi:hypothetical protein
MKTSITPTQNEGLLLQMAGRTERGVESTVAGGGGSSGVEMIDYGEMSTGAAARYHPTPAQ